MAQTENIHESVSVDAQDVAKFQRLGAQWWDPAGPMRGLHQLNPIRIAYIRDHLTAHFPAADGGARSPRSARPLKGLRLLDIGCGGGLLSEPLSRLGASMTSIDPAPGNVEIARTHAEAAGLAIDYRAITAEALAETGVLFDAVLTMEVLEHVADLQAFCTTAARMVRPGGLLLAATLNRTLKSYALAIVGAEYVLRWVEPGTHDWNRFVTPAELETALTASGLTCLDQAGMSFHPLTGSWTLSEDLDVNYLLTAQKPAP
jgi:2-polyprenyl-6-hydroxyphenyl methylase/3-demethylubiquinone-9 3-methyltransferase